MKESNLKMIDEIFEVLEENFELTGEGDNVQIGAAVGMVIDRVIEG